MKTQFPISPSVLVVSQLRQMTEMLMNYKVTVLAHLLIISRSNLSIFHSELPGVSGYPYEMAIDDSSPLLI